MELEHSKASSDPEKVGIYDKHDINRAIAEAGKAERGRQLQRIKRGIVELLGKNPEDIQQALGLLTEGERGKWDSFINEAKSTKVQ